MGLKKTLTWFKSVLVLGVLGALLATSAQAQTTYGEEAKTRLQLAERVAPLSEDTAFGERIGQFTGGLSFRYVDVSLPGNDELPVEFARNIGNDYSPNFWGWDVDIPKITSVMPESWNEGWTPDPPPSVDNDNSVEFRRVDYWNGFRMRVNGQTEPLLYRAAEGQLPSDPRTPIGPSPGGQWRFMTKSGWLFKVVPAPKDQTGSVLEALAPNGLRYYFNHLITDFYDVLEHPTKLRVVTVNVPGGTVSSAYPERLPRKIYVLYLSRIEDRFNNWVEYQWSGSKLNKILASDGREITITSLKVVPTLPEEQDPRYQVTGVTVGNRNWTYTRNPTAGFDEVRNPDGSKWTYQGGFGPIVYDRIRFNADLTPVSNIQNIADCTKAYPFTPAQSRTLSVTAPSNAKAVYRLEPRRHGRSKTPYACNAMNDDQQTWTSRIPRFVDDWTLVSKEVSGPGVQTVTTAYDYSGTNLSFDPSAAAYVSPDQIWNPSTDGLKTVTATRSDGEVREYVFGRNYGVNEGLLLSEQIYASDPESKEGKLKLYRQTDYTHVGVDENATQLFSLAWGGSGVGFSDNFTNLHVPARSTTITQDGVQFRRQVLSFDKYVSPTSVQKSSSGSGFPGYSKTEGSQNHNSESLWILGRPGTQTTDGIETSRVVYNPTTSLPQYVYHFNEAQPSQTIGYTNAGLVETVTDARNKTMTFSGWWRGVPGRITFHDQTYATAETDSNGWIRKVTGQSGFSTCYEHDPMGRTNLIRWPGDVICAPASGPAWAPGSISFSASTTAEWGLPVGHWVRTESRGNFRRTTRYDAFWRPVMAREWDNANPTQTQRFVGWKYDTSGRQVFAADARSTASSVASFGTAGLSSEYDPLGRITRSYRPWELSGILETRYEYLPGFRTSVRNPRNGITVSDFQAYDLPDTSLPVAIQAPEGASTSIIRDVFGKPTSIRRSGTADGSPISVTRDYAYDAQQRLCIQTEPETRSTIMDYDVAGNLLWSASGLNLPSTTCDRTLAPEKQKVRRTYDDLNRISTLSFPDELGNQSWLYTPDGLPRTVTTLNATNVAVANRYTYNNLRLIDTEQLEQNDGNSWSLGYGYSTNGHLSSVGYPSGLSVNYAPNALGQATAAGSFANTVLYHPNGAIDRFTYGNGLMHQMTPNARALAERSKVSLGSTVVLDDTYHYDENANIVAISDGLPGQRGNRLMGYDLLDRLQSTSSPMFGVANYTYDSIDNLRRVSVSQGTRSRDHRYGYDSNQRLTQVLHANTGAPIESLTYDERGNLSRRGGQDYTFDVGNRLRGVTGLEQYRYDGHGRRIRAVHPTQGTIHSLYGNDGVLRVQRDERAGKSTEFVYLAGSMVARVSTPIVSVPAAPVLSVPPTSTGSYVVSWTPSAGASYYPLEERSGASPWVQIQGSSALSTAVASRPAGTYDYRVRACPTSGATGCSVYSNIGTVVVTSVPSPVLSAPPTSSNGSYTVTWTPVAGATTYRLEEQVLSVWTEVQNSGTTQRPYTGKPNGTYGYRVRACLSAAVTDCSLYSNIVTVVVGNLPPAPVVSVPATSNTGSYIVSWNPVAGATVYRLEEGIAGVWTELPSVTSTQYSVIGKSNGTYSYRARACLTVAVTDCSVYSNVATVTVAVTIPPPILTAPSSNNTGNYQVSWTPSSAATTYRLEEQANGGSWSEIQNANTSVANISGKPDGLYAYRVRACAGVTIASCSGFSNVATVSVVLLPPVPVISAPASNNTGSYTVTWTPSNGASLYRLEERVNGGGWSEIQTTSLSRAFTGKANGTYGYRVRACRSALVAECSDFSNIASVVVTLVPVPVAPTLSGGGSNATGNYTVLWTAPAGAVEYRLDEQSNGGVWLEIQKDSNTSRNLVGKSSGTYAYRVRACGSADVAHCSTHSNVVTFIVTIPVAPPVPTISGPTTSSPDFEFELTWTASVGAIRYELQQNRNGSTFSNEYTGPLRVYRTQRGSGANYGFRVRACSDTICSAYSSEHHVVVDGGPVLPQPPTLTAPATSATGSYPLSWTASSGATFYRLEERSINGSWGQIYGGSGTTFSVSNRPSGTFEYQVRACLSSGQTTCGGPSIERTVVVTLVQIPPVPTLSAPPSSTGSYTVSWDPTNGATIYRLDERFNNGTWAEVQATSATTRPFSSKPDGSYDYRVRACASTNVAECSTHSNMVNVVVNAGDIPPPVPGLNGPATSGTGNFSLNWNSTSGASNYRIEEQVGNGSWIEIAQVSILTHAINGKPNGTYRYKVRACTAWFVCSAYSNTVTVVVTIEQIPATAPTGLTGPATVSVNDLFTMSWNAVPHATSYKLQHNRNNQGWSNTTTTSNLSVTTQRGQAGSYVFRVQACSEPGCSAYSTTHTVVVTGSIE